MLPSLLLALQGSALARPATAEPTWVVFAGDRAAPGEFSGPRSVAVDPRGDVYVAEWGNNRVQKLSPSGEPLAQWGSSGSAPGQFSNPSRVAVDGRGYVYVTDSGNNRVQRLSP